MLYIAGIARKLQEISQGFSLRHMEEGARSGGRVPNLSYADIMLMADSLQVLQALMTECGKMGAALGLGFSAQKLALIS